MTEKNPRAVSPAVEQHVIPFHADEGMLIDQIWNFVSPALLAGDPVILIAGSARLAKLESRLARHRWSEGLPLNAGSRCTMLDAEQALSRITVNGQISEQRFHEVIGAVVAQAAEQGSSRIKAYGEMVALLYAKQEEEAAVRLERFWNTLIGRHPLSLLCACPTGALSGKELREPFRQIGDAHMPVRAALSHSQPESEADPQRAIASLRQKAAALESELARHMKIEKGLSVREQELSDFLENAPDGMHRVGPDGTILWANKAELQLLGYARDEYIGRNIAEFHVDRDIITDALKRLRQGEILHGCEARMRCKDGSVRHVLIHSNARTVDGEFVSTRCLTRDVTERVLLEQERNRRLEQLAETDRRKDEFLALLGHELRNPLAPILTSLEVMRLRDDDPSLLLRSREMIERQVALMTRLVDDLLDASRIARGKVALQTERVTLDCIVERALEIVRPLIDERGHELVLNMPAGPVVFYGDPARLAQALANLLHNAARYTEPGGRISLHARTEGSALEISIADNGAGLDPALLGKVFDLFVQGEGSSADARGGLGIGLALARGLVQLHGGTVAARSEGIGRGSEFMMTLPLPGPPSKSAQAPAADAGGEPARITGPRHILIVDDNVDAAESLGEFLKVSGHRVDIAHDGASALAQAARFQPDVVILDIGMPAMDGYQVASRLRSQVGLTSSILIAVTGYAQERDRISARQAGFDYHFAKPLDIDRLAGLINGSK